MGLFFSIVIASLIVSLVAFAGVILLFSRKLMQDGPLSYFTGFAAGILLASAFFDLLPEAFGRIKDTEKVLPLVFAGIVGFFFLERFVLWFHHHDEPHQLKPSSILILFGDGVHNFVDGIAIAAAFLTSPALGVTTTIAIIAHEFPHEVADFSVLVSGGMEKQKALFFNFLSGLTALAGAITGFFFLAQLQTLIPFTLAFTAGMFIYIACSDLIPDLHQRFMQNKNWSQSVPFVLGAATLIVLVRFLEG